MRIEERATDAHILGRHASMHPEDRAFWAKTCSVCAVINQVQPWMVAGAEARARTLTDEVLEVEANLPIDGMGPGEMLERIVAERELARRRG